MISTKKYNVRSREQIRDIKRILCQLQRLALINRQSGGGCPAQPGPEPIKKISLLNFRYAGLESSYWLFESSKCSDQSECLKTTIAEIMIQFHFYIGTTPGGTGFKTTALKQSRDRLLGL